MKYIAQVMSDRGKELYYDIQDDRTRLEERLALKLDNNETRLKWVKSGDVMSCVTVSISIYSEDFEIEKVVYHDEDYL